MSDEIRDIGPYENPDQAMRQFANWSRNMPLTGESAGKMLLREALMIAGVEPSQFEAEYISTHQMDPMLATILHGLVLRVHLGTEARRD